MKRGYWKKCMCGRHFTGQYCAWKELLYQRATGCFTNNNEKYILKVIWLYYEESLYAVCASEHYVNCIHCHGEARWTRQSYNTHRHSPFQTQMHAVQWQFQKRTLSYLLIRALFSRLSKITLWICMRARCASLLCAIVTCNCVFREHREENVLSD